MLRAKTREYSLLLNICRISILLVAASGTAAEKVRVCHLASKQASALPRALDTSKDFIGFRTGIKDHSTARRSYEFKQIAAAESDYMKRLAATTSDNCDVVVGLVSSRDALLAGPHLRKHGLVGISSTATADEISAFWPNIISLATSQQSWIEDLKKTHLFLHAQQRIVISDSSDAFSALYTSRIQKAVPSIIRAEMGKDGLISPAILNNIPPRTLFVFTTYPMHSLRAIEQLQSAIVSRKIAVIGTQPWMETQVFRSFRDRIQSTKGLFVLSPLPLRPSTILMKLRKDIYKAAATEIDHDSAYDYDSIGLIDHCLSQGLTSQTISQRLLTCFKNPITFDGAIGPHRFVPLSSSSQRSEQLLPFNLIGYLPR